MSDKPCVLAFRREGWRDVTATLRRIADRIDSGDLPIPTTCSLVMLSDGGALEVFGLGEKADDLQLIGLLRIGEQRIVDNLLSE